MKSSAVSIGLMMLSLAACATSGPGSFCDNAKPIYFDKADQVTDRTKRAIIAHDEKGAALCGWR